jgi:hypothetical protein
MIILAWALMEAALAAEPLQQGTAGRAFACKADGRHGPSRSLKTALPFSVAAGRPREESDSIRRRGAAELVSGLSSARPDDG